MHALEPTPAHHMHAADLLANCHWLAAPTISAGKAVTINVEVKLMQATDLFRQGALPPLSTEQEVQSSWGAGGAQVLRPPA